MRLAMIAAAAMLAGCALEPEPPEPGPYPTADRYREGCAAMDDGEVGRTKRSLAMCRAGHLGREPHGCVAIENWLHTAIGLCAGARLQRSQEMAEWQRRDREHRQWLGRQAAALEGWRGLNRPGGPLNPVHVIIVP